MVTEPHTGSTNWWFYRALLWLVLSLSTPLANYRILLLTCIIEEERTTQLDQTLGAVFLYRHANKVDHNEGNCMNFRVLYTPNKFTCHTHFAQLGVRMRSFRKDSARNELVKGHNTTAMERSSTMGIDTRGWGGGWSPPKIFRLCNIYNIHAWNK